MQYYLQACWTAFETFWCNLSDSHHNLIDELEQIAVPVNIEKSIIFNQNWTQLL